MTESAHSVIRVRARIVVVQQRINIVCVIITVVGVAVVRAFDQIRRVVAVRLVEHEIAVAYFVHQMS